MCRHLIARYRWLIIAVIGVGAVFLLFQRRGELAQGVAVLSGIDPRWIVALGLAQGVAIALSALTFRIALRQLGHNVAWLRLIDIHLQRHLVATITPLGGPASVYVFVRALHKRGISANDALFAMVLRGIVGYTAFILLAIPVAIAFRPSGLILTAAALLAGVLAVMVGLLLALLHGRAVPARIQRRMPERVRLFIEQARGHGIRPRNLAPLLVAGIGTNLGSVLVLYLALRAVGSETTVTTAATGYAVGNLLQIVAPVFQGIGVVEVSMVATLQQLDAAATAAIGATLLYRLADLWLPVAVGLTVHVCRINLTRRVAGWMAGVAATGYRGLTAGVGSASAGFSGVRAVPAAFGAFAVTTLVFGHASLAGVVGAFDIDLVAVLLILIEGPLRAVSLLWPAVSLAGAMLP